jgi:acylphosphatase
MIKSVELKIFGKVQGVFYRQNAMNKAFDLGLSGFVRNESDGSVYLRAQGDAKAIEQLIEWCRRGPENAVVSEVVIFEKEQENLGAFRIIR